MTEPPTEQQLAEWERLAGEATPGPWIWNRDTRDLLPRLENEDGDRKELWWCDADDCFIAAARDAVPALVAEVRRLRRAEHNLRSGFQQKLSAAYLEAARAREGR